MFFCLKPQHVFNTLPALTLSASALEWVYSYKYLGLILTCTLSWTSHISAIKKIPKIFGLIYQHFYSHSSTPVLLGLSLYKTIIRLVLEYSSAVWNPHSSSLTASIESVQHFEVKLISKSWSSPYSTLWFALNLTTLKHRRKKSKLTLPHAKSLSCNKLPSWTNYPTLNISQKLLHPYLQNTLLPNHHLPIHSFFPTVIKLTTLPHNIKHSNSISLLKQFLHNHTYEPNTIIIINYPTIIISEMLLSVKKIILSVLTSNI